MKILLIGTLASHFTQIEMRLHAVGDQIMHATTMEEVVAALATGHVDKVLVDDSFDPEKYRKIESLLQPNVSIHQIDAFSRG